MTNICGHTIRDTSIELLLFFSTFHRNGGSRERSQQSNGGNEAELHGDQDLHVHHL